MKGSLARLAPNCIWSIERLASCWAKTNNKLETSPGAERVNAGARGGHVTLPARN
jgi:hypothetical protein